MENATKALIIAGSILIAIMLITVGIVLVNSGKGVTDSGIAAMNIQKVATFNSQFTPYEGTKKGAEIKGLWNVVNSSNGVSEKQVTIEPASMPSNLKPSSTYTVSFDDYEDGYIKKITVTGPGIS